ncbi:MAG: peptidoglycan DD-metalloendopeptidase family protein [Notoacmeibacter sp.]|nr:peptidoglycan DD-metalloendopeptidase family protein [Notoacmeibacter sp.]MCC0031829.1 peptidoglycan DD-metalloendopeptidase family protein [Brucellaceae bacterium]
MSMKISSNFARHLARGAAIALVGGMAAGCSSDASRFTDSFFTNSVPQRQAVAPESQPYPGDLDTTATGSVSRSGADVIPGGRVTPKASLSDVSRSYPATPQQAYPVDRNTYPAAPARQALQPVDVAPAPAAVQRSALPAAPANVDRMATGAVSRQAAPVGAPKPSYTHPALRPVSSVPAAAPSVAPVAKADDTSERGGWTATGGTAITLKEGETVYNLSKRFGVPAKEIMRVNGIADASKVSAGQRVIIPTYVYSSKAPVSMPDSNPNTMAAKSSRGTKYDAGKQVPAPVPADRKDVAVLPTVPQARNRSGSVPLPQASNSSNAAKAAAPSGAYTVVSGDSLYAIAKRNGVTVDALKTANGLKDGNLKIGQRLTIPSASAKPVATASAKSNPGVDPIITGTPGPARTSSNLPTYTPPVRKDEKVIREAEKVAAVAPDATGISKMRWPVRGRVVAGYGANVNGKANDGIDIAVPAGTPVKAAENGVVIYAGDGLKEFGNTVLLRHENGLVSVYGHNSELSVKRGDKVRRGDQIAKAGNSGSADMPKLHFEIRKDSSPVNPASYLE